MQNNLIFECFVLPPVCDRLSAVSGTVLQLICGAVGTRRPAKCVMLSIWMPFSCRSSRNSLSSSCIIPLIWSIWAVVNVCPLGGVAMADVEYCSKRLVIADAYE